MSASSRNSLTRTRVLILTTFDLDEYAYVGLRAGASGFLVKDAQPEDLLSGIRAVATGDAVVAPSLTRRLLEAYAQDLPTPGDPTDAPAEPDARLASLTDREREILPGTVIGKGWTNTGIATRLHLADPESTDETGTCAACAQVSGSIEPFRAFTSEVKIDYRPKGWLTWEDVGRPP